MVYAIFKEYSYGVHGGRVYSSLTEAVAAAEQFAGQPAEVVEDDYAEVGEFYVEALDLV